MEWYEITLLILLVITLIGFLIFLGAKSNQNKEEENERNAEKMRMDIDKLQKTC